MDCFFFHSDTLNFPVPMPLQLERWYSQMGTIIIIIIIVITPSCHLSTHFCFVCIFRILPGPWLDVLAFLPTCRLCKCSKHNEMQ